MKAKYFSYILYIFLIIYFGCTPKDEKEVSFTSSNDSLSIYFSLANDFSLPKNVRSTYSKKAYNIVVGDENDSLNRVNLFKVANRYYNINDWKEFNKTVHFVLENSERVNDTSSIIKAYTYLGDYYQSQTILDSSFLYYYKAEKMYSELGDNFNLAKTLINKATLQYRAGDFLGSEKSVFSVLRIIKNEKNTSNILYDAYNLLGIIYSELGEYDNAIIYHNKALTMSDDEAIPKVFQSKATTYNNIGFLYLNLKKYALAQTYFKKGLEENNLKIQKPALYAMLIDNLAYAKFMSNDTNKLPGLFYEALKIRDSIKLSSGIFINKIHLSEYYSSVKATSTAISFAKEALSLSKKANIPRDVLVALKQLSVVDPENASIYSKEYITINEQLQKEERSMGEKFSRIEYETDKIKDQNSILEDQNRNLIYIFSVIGILGLFTYVIKAQQSKNKILLYKQLQQQANEDTYNLMISQQQTIDVNRVLEKKRVAQELHDGVLGRMFGVRMNLEGLNPFDDALAVEQRVIFLNELKNIEQDIREISHDLNREKSELINNFVAIVSDLLEKQSDTFDPVLISNIDGAIKWDLLINSVKINLYRIIQESLQNCNKYAQATTIRVELKKREENLVLTISDNGVGFIKKNKIKGIGINNMISRTHECNGTFDISSVKGEGTTITVTVPIEQKQIPI
ncbi:tetratricopeptide repeat-containing sensor histidine kinase [Flavobacterium muglaense]|uniref:histidine kinase n=1 Tax=Flavobacterium muglaense TaxID=2764716 RepID=A0A923N1B8_9FLAO|nr:tetratricopeptide repeat protein [Flavobacterium muglaense]MBC5837375.1 tetratricopeptide repeat protein [Flavobacterium muglaense]MBC5843893.1 tetratricopeptide repeat protein [Flavobacterium muglaense]